MEKMKRSEDHWIKLSTVLTCLNNVFSSEQA